MSRPIYPSKMRWSCPRCLKTADFIKEVIKDLQRGTERIYYVCPVCRYPLQVRDGQDRFRNTEGE